VKPSRRTLALVAVAYLGGCASSDIPLEEARTQIAARSAIEEWQSPTYGPEQRFVGVFREGFETSSFLGCWLDWTDPARNDFVRSTGERGPDDRARAIEYELEIIGRRTIGVPVHMPQYGYGHLSMYPCQILVTSVLRARRLPPRSPGG
jgi:hypothetical protein